MLLNKICDKKSFVCKIYEKLNVLIQKLNIYGKEKKNKLSVKLIKNV